LNSTSQSSPPSRKREREKLTSSIKSTYGRRLAASPEDAKEGSSVKRQKESQGTNGSGTPLSQSARDPRDEAPITPPATLSRSASPYTLQPPIDYDGLSWPSMFCHL